MLDLAARVLLREHGELLFSRDPDLAILDKKSLEAGEQREIRDAAIHLGVVEGEVLELSEALKEGQATAQCVGGRGPEAE